MREKRFVTFGQSHKHHINGVVYDKDCVAVVNGNRETVFQVFGPKFSFEYKPEDWDPKNMRHFPRGYIPVNTTKET